jgi:hypothetical protein
VDDVAATGLQTLKFGGEQVVSAFKFEFLTTNSKISALF